MSVRVRPGLILPALLSACLIAGCAATDTPLQEPVMAFIVEDDGSRFTKHAPVFIVEAAAEEFNRIGTPEASLDEDGDERLAVNPHRPAIYVREIPFETEKAEYTNLVYRVHFERVPAWNLTMGRNVGLFAIVTLDQQERPVLLTTVHTCGCYVAFVPTSYLPESSLPEDWCDQEQDAYGETLPCSIRLTDSSDADQRIVITLRDETHRVRDIDVRPVGALSGTMQTAPLPLRPMQDLENLSLNGETTSFFHTSGSRKGYVKGAEKPLEMLFVSWLAFDFRVGRDKALGRLRRRASRCTPVSSSGAGTTPTSGTSPGCCATGVGGFSGGLACRIGRLNFRRG